MTGPKDSYPVATTPEGSLEITLSRPGAIVLGLEVDPFPEKYRPVVLTGERALVAARYLADYLKNGISPELLRDATSPNG